MLLHARHVFDYDLVLTRWLQLPGRYFIALHRIGRGDIEISVAQRDAGNAGVTELFLHLEAAVAVGVAQRGHAAIH
jgi:hypothetical protein